eukprot:TRINITY_DN15233_c0_g2_i1.p2 TRINITY_DN15233_c0_g2~~TRINITY_DN15233_c0_g2_i1.p2  ORF type:complete len:219 (+),score=45.73 TRINITY_DN15233_c0_g2_i1:122-778(+)
MQRANRQLSGSSSLPALRNGRSDGFGSPAGHRSPSSTMRSFRSKEVADGLPALVVKCNGQYLTMPDELYTLEGVQQELRNGCTRETFLLYDCNGRRLLNDFDVYQAASEGLTPINAHLGHGVCVGSWDMPAKLARFVDPKDELPAEQRLPPTYRRKTGLVVPEFLRQTLEMMSKEGFKHTAGTQKAFQKQLQEAVSADRKKFEATQNNTVLWDKHMKL